jgi:hypothetical protein
MFSLCSDVLSVRTCCNLVNCNVLQAEQSATFQVLTYVARPCQGPRSNCGGQKMTMIGMPIGKKTPKSELHEFYQLHPGNPTFAIKSMSNPPAEPLFLCTLTCPGIGGPQGLPEQSFTGQGRNKKTAEQYAAEKALGCLRQRGLMAPALVEMAAQQLPPDLQRQLAGTCTQTTTVSSTFPECLYQNLPHA